MEFHPTGKWKKGIVVSKRIPDEWLKLQMQYSTSLYYEGNFGRFLSQQSRWNGMMFQQVNMYLNQPTIFQVSTDKPSIFLLYLLKGKVTMSLNKTVIKAEKNSCWLCYFPTGKQYVDFLPAQHHWFLIGLKHAYLTQLSEKLQEVKLLIAHARSRKQISFWLETGRISHRIRQLIRKITACMYESPARELYIQSRVKELLAICALHLKAFRASISADLSSKENFVSYIAQRLDDTITIETMAKDFHISASVLKKKFRLLLGSAVHQYIQEQRLQQARQLIIHTKLSVYTISLRTGFADPSHLIKRFKTRFGETPERFRKKIKPTDN